MIELKCKCGHQADLMDFCSTPIRGELPNGEFQCPACNRAWKKVETEPGTTIQTEAGPLYLPGKVKCINTQPSL